MNIINGMDIGRPNRIDKLKKNSRRKKQKGKVTGHEWSYS